MHNKRKNIQIDLILVGQVHPSDSRECFPGICRNLVTKNGQIHDTVDVDARVLCLFHHPKNKREDCAELQPKQKHMEQVRTDQQIPQTATDNIILKC